LPGCGGSAKYYTNDQDGRAHGVELTGNWRIRHNLSLDAWYTHTETYLTRHGSIVTDPVNVQLVAVPKDVASFGATWSPVEKLRTFAEIRHIGSMLLDTTSNSGSMRFGQGSNTIVNASVSYAWSPSLDVFANVVNLFDQEYSENAYTWNQPYNRTLSQPRALNTGVKLRF
jgi:outer membrane receptor protein involved in Fe transport